MIINHRLLLDIRLDRVWPRRVVFLHNIDDLIYFFPQTEDREITNSIKKIIVKRAPLIYFYLLVHLLLIWWLHPARILVWFLFGRFISLLLILVLLFVLLLFLLLIDHPVHFIFVIWLADFIEVAYDVKSLFLVVFCGKLVNFVLNLNISLHLNIQALVRLGPKPVAGFAENFLVFSKFDSLASIGTREMEELIAAFVFSTAHRGSVLATDEAFLMHELGLLLVKVDELPVFYFEDFVCPKSATCVNVHV